MLFYELVGAGVASIFVYASHMTSKYKTEKYKLSRIFRNLGYGKNDRYPRLVNLSRNNSETTYVYSVPYGLVDDPKISQAVSKTLAKDATISMSNGKLVVKVVEAKLGKKYSYDWRNTREIPVGYTASGIIYHDFDKIPHMTIAGMTRQGKTVLLKLLLAHILNNSDAASVDILDLKGGLEFGRFSDLSHVGEVADDSDSALRLLKRVDGDISRRMVEFRRLGLNNIVNSSDSRRNYIIVDEAAELNKDCLEILSRVARIGGALGYRLIFATQYPTADTLPRQIKQNADAKISFRLPTATASRVAIDENGAEDLPCPGRAIYRTIDRAEIQVPYVSDDEIMDKMRRLINDRETTEEISERGSDSFTIE